jgi:hypothetical protein
VDEVRKPGGAVLDRPGAMRPGDGSMKWIFLLVRGVVGALGELTNLCKSSHWPVEVSLRCTFQEFMALPPSSGLSAPMVGRGPMTKVVTEAVVTLSLLDLR